MPSIRARRGDAALALVAAALAILLAACSAWAMGGIAKIGRASCRERV